MTLDSETATTASGSNSEVAMLTAPKRTKLAARPHRASAISNRAGIVRSTKWNEREELRKKQEASKNKEREMRQMKEDVETKKREERLERKRKKEERERLDAMATKMSRKKLDRKRRRMGLTKKVAH